MTDFLPVLSGGTAKGFLEPPTEITGGAETAALTDLGDTFFALKQHAGGHADAVIVEISDGGHAKTPLKTPGAFPLADGSGIGDVFQGQLAGIIVVDKTQHHLDPLNIGIGMFGNRILPIGG